MRAHSLEGRHGDKGPKFFLLTEQFTSCGLMEEPEIRIVEISLKKVLKYMERLNGYLGFWLLTKMIHYGIPLYLIHHPEELLALLHDAKPVGLEVNLPPSALQDVYPGKNNLRVDLVFKKRNLYYLVEAKSRKPRTQEKHDLKEYARRFREFVHPEDQVFPIMVYPCESPQQALMSLMRDRKSAKAN